MNLKRKRWNLPEMATRRRRTSHIPLPEAEDTMNTEGDVQASKWTMSGTLPGGPRRTKINTLHADPTSARGRVWGAEQGNYSNGEDKRRKEVIGRKTVAGAAQTRREP